MNYRLEGLQRQADEIEQHLRKDLGLLPPDLEVIGALLFVKFRGEDERINQMLSNSNKVLKEVDDFLRKIQQNENI